MRGRRRHRRPGGGGLTEGAPNPSLADARRGERAVTHPSDFRSRRMQARLIHGRARITTEDGGKETQPDFHEPIPSVGWRSDAPQYPGRNRRSLDRARCGRLRRRHRVDRPQGRRGCPASRPTGHAEAEPPSRRGPTRAHALSEESTGRAEGRASGSTIASAEPRSDLAGRFARNSSDAALGIGTRRTWGPVRIGDASCFAPRHAAVRRSLVKEAQLRRGGAVGVPRRPPGQLDRGDRQWRPHPQG
jgi:hypothetical protein